MQDLTLQKERLKEILQSIRSTGNWKTHSSSRLQSILYWQTSHIRTVAMFGEGGPNILLSETPACHASDSSKTDRGIGIFDKANTSCPFKWRHCAMSQGLVPELVLTMLLGIHCHSHHSGILVANFPTCSGKPLQV